MSYIPRPDIIWQRLKELERLVRRLLTQSPLGFSSITRGSLRVASNEGLIVEGSAKVSGWLIVTGTERVVGRLEGSGTFDWTGPMYLRGAQNITGDVTFTGHLTVTGPWTLVGAGEITGDVDLTGDIRVLSGGRILVGDMIIDPSGGGSVTFPGGAEVSADPGGGIRMIQGTNRVYVGSGLVSLQYGTRSWSVSGSGHRMGGAETIPSSLAGGAPAGTLWSSTSGDVYRVV